MASRAKKEGTRPTAEQITEYKEAFSAIDKDSSGLIDKAELDQLFRKLGKTPSKTQLDAMVSKADVDGDGQISFDEFTKMMMRPDKFVTFESELKEAFNVFDKDSNGSISAQELLKTMQDLGEIISEEEIALMIKEADMDGEQAFAVF
jgi:Ca2+-binding EF-hand superfamily protein